MSGGARYTDVHNSGLKAERLIIGWLRREGYRVTEASREENIWNDVDCYLTGLEGSPMTVSIKSQARGYFFQNFGFELCTQRPVANDLTNDGHWRKSWYYHGKASHYLILWDISFLQPWQMPDWDNAEQLRLSHKPCYFIIPKLDIQARVERWGWQRVSGLNEATLKGQGGYDTKSGYLSLKSLLRDKPKGSADYQHDLPDNWKELAEAVL